MRATVAQSLRNQILAKGITNTSCGLGHVALGPRVCGCSAPANRCRCNYRGGVQNGVKHAFLASCMWYRQVVGRGSQVIGRRRCIEAAGRRHTTGSAKKRPVTLVFDSIGPTWTARASQIVTGGRHHSSRREPRGIPVRSVSTRKSSTPVVSSWLIGSTGCARLAGGHHPVVRDLP